MNIDTQLDNICRDIVQIRDEGKPCIICKLGRMTKYDQVCHFFHRRHHGTRWNTLNLHLGHQICNQKEEGTNGQGDKDLMLEHMSNVVDFIGYNNFEYLKSMRFKNVHFSKSDKLELLKELKIELKRTKIQTI